MHSLNRRRASATAPPPELLTLALALALCADLPSESSVSAPAAVVAADRAAAGEEEEEEEEEAEADVESVSSGWSAPPSANRCRNVPPLLSLLDAMRARRLADDGDEPGGEPPAPRPEETPDTNSQPEKAGGETWVKREKCQRG
jgi:hypothetical protein